MRRRWQEKMRRSLAAVELQSAVVRDGSNRGTWLLRPRLRHQGKADRLVCGQRADDGVIKIFEPSEIHIVVAGGETQGAWKMISGSLRATVSIDAWRCGQFGGIIKSFLTQHVGP